MEKLLAYSRNEEEFHSLDAGTIEEAVKELIKKILVFEFDCIEYDKAIIYIGEQVPYGEDRGSECYDDIIEYFQENAYDEGGEYAESYLDNISKEAEEFLKRGLDRLFAEFLNMNKEKKTWYSVENVRAYEIYKDGSFRKLKEKN